jgi:hypothetical protein
MSNLKLILLFVFTLNLIIPINSYPQDADIVVYLKQVEDGNKDIVADKLPSLKKKYPGSSSIMFLEGVLTEDGKQAVSIYTDLLKKYPQSRYADASLYRICAYYYATGNYSAVKSNLNRLKKDYPESPYIKLSDRNMPGKDMIIDEKVTEQRDTINDKPSQPVETEEYRYTIQAGAFTLADNAKLLKTDLDNAGYFTKIEDKIVAGTSFHIIYVGKYVNQEDAKSFLKILNKKFNLGGRVVGINSK